MIKSGWFAGVLFMLPALAVAQPMQGRLETGVFFTFAELARIASTDHGVDGNTAGLGGRVSWRAIRFLDIDAELSVHPRAGVQGYRVQGYAGTKVGAWFGPFGIHAKIRPGFWYFERDPFGAIAARSSVFERPRWADSLEPAIDYGATVQCATPRNVLFRLDVGETRVHYRARTVPASGALPPREVGGFSTRNYQWSVGIGKRF